MVLGVNVTLHEGVMVVCISEDGVSPFYEIANRLTNYRAFIVQHGEPVIAATVLQPSQATPWSYTNSQGSGLVDITLEEVGLQPDGGNSRTAKRVGEVVSLDISRIGTSARLQHAGRTLQLKIILRGTTRVLELSSLSQNPTQEIYLERLRSYERRCLHQSPIGLSRIDPLSRSPGALEGLFRFEKPDGWVQKVQGDQVRWQLKEKQELAAVTIVVKGDLPASLELTNGGRVLQATLCTTEHLKDATLGTFLVRDEAVDTNETREYAWSIPAGIRSVHHISMFELAQQTGQINVCLQVVEAYGLQLPLLFKSTYVTVQYGSAIIKSNEVDGENPVYDTQVSVSVQDLLRPIVVKVMAISVLSKEIELYSQKLDPTILFPEKEKPQTWDGWVLLSECAAVRLVLAHVNGIKEWLKYASLLPTQNYQETLELATRAEASTAKALNEARREQSGAHSVLRVRLGVCEIGNAILRDGPLYASVTFGTGVHKTVPAKLEHRATLKVTVGEDGPLGLRLRHVPNGRFVVDTVGCGPLQGSGVLAGMELFCIQGVEIRCNSLAMLAPMLEGAARPLELTFCRKAKPGNVLVSFDDELDFSDVDTIIGEARGGWLRMALFQLVGHHDEIIDVGHESRVDRDVVVPLLYLFGTDEEVDQKGREASEAYCATDVLVGVARYKVPDRRQTKCTGFKACLRNGPWKVGRLDVELRWESKLSDVGNACKVDTLLDVSFEQAGVSVVSGFPKREELLYACMTSVQICISQLQSGKTLADVQVSRIQVDNQMTGAVHPVLLSMKSLRIPDTEDTSTTVETLPALKVTTLFQSFAAKALYIEYMDCFLQETTLKIEERVLLELQRVFGSMQSNNQEDRSSDDILRLLQRDPLLGALSGEKNGDGLSQSEQSIMVGSLDIKPTRIFLTFTANQDEDEAGSNFNFLQILRGIPLLEGLSSVLVNTLVSITNAPLQFDYLKISNDKKTLASFVAILTNTYKAQAMQSLLNVVGATDILGSPVQLVQSFGKGAYSFFYEPALAMSQGYGQIGTGLQRGSLDLVFSALRATSESLLKVSGTASKALARSSMDPSFVRRNARRLRSSANDPIFVHEGIRRALRAIWLGFAEGFTGLGDPGRSFGSSQRSLVALTSNTATSTGRAALGVLAKPASGLVNAVHEVSRAVINSTDSDYSTLYPVRLQRHIPALAEPLNVYSGREAVGLAYLKFLKLDVDCEYIYHVQTTSPGENCKAVVILTRRLLIAVTTKLSVAWVIPLAVITLLSTGTLFI